jgi:hypothetical protein
VWKCVVCESASVRGVVQIMRVFLVITSKASLSDSEMQYK